MGNQDIAGYDHLALNLQLLVICFYNWKTKLASNPRLVVSKRTWLPYHKRFSRLKVNLTVNPELKNKPSKDLESQALGTGESSNLPLGGNRYTLISLEQIFRRKITGFYGSYVLT